MPKDNPHTEKTLPKKRHWYKKKHAKETTYTHDAHQNTSTEKKMQKKRPTHRQNDVQVTDTAIHREKYATTHEQKQSINVSGTCFLPTFLTRSHKTRKKYMETITRYPVDIVAVFNRN